MYLIIHLHPSIIGYNFQAKLTQAATNRHYRESGNDFSRHLHNGESLKNFTRKVPAHRPYVLHGPPFKFEESAVDALIFQNMVVGS